MKNFVTEFLAKELDNFLHRNPSVADALKKRIEQNERERKELAGIKKLANERAKKANLHNKKLRDCRVHLNEEAPTKNKEVFISNQQNTTLFITEGDSAKTLAIAGLAVVGRHMNGVFPLKGKILNVKDILINTCPNLW